MYYKRLVDDYLVRWAADAYHKPLLLRGARQVGKSTAVREFGKSFEHYVEINLEKYETYRKIFSEQNLDVNRIVAQLSAFSGQAIEDGNTLLFIDEIQCCPEAIMSLRYFKEERPGLHVIAAGSLLEFALEELPTYGVGRIHSMYIYPMTFDEFLMATGNTNLLNYRRKASTQNPLPEAIYNKLIGLFRTYILVGGMPAVVAKWVETGDYLKCMEVQDDIVEGYINDFPKYKKRVNAILLVNTMKSVVSQVTQKFVYNKVEGDYRSADVKYALEMLTKAGIITPVTHTSANGLPLGEGANASVRKFLFIDSGLMLRIQNMTLGNAQQMSESILTSTVTELVNKGPLAEMIAGLELLRYMPDNISHAIYYWNCQNKSSQAEVDYLLVKNAKVIPFEVKAGVQGGMKSLWYFMREKNLTEAVRCSLENFGEFTYTDATVSPSAQRHVTIVPLFAISQMQ